MNEKIEGRTSRRSSALATLFLVLTLGVGFEAQASVVGCMDLDETYYGHWFNDTFASVGPAVIRTQIAGALATFDVDMDGGVFGVGDPANVNFTGSVAGDIITINATGLMTYGTIAGTINCSTGVIAAIVSMIPMVSFDDVTVTGLIDNDAISASYSIDMMGMLFATGTMVVSAPGIASSDFEVDSELWRDIDNGSGSVSRPVSGGNPSGFLQITDAGAFSFNEFAALAPGKFLGDLSSLDGGTFSFDARANSNAGSPTLSSFAFVQITGEGAQNTAGIDFDMGLPPADTWTNYSMPFDAATFGVSQGAWDAILAEARMITIRLDPGPVGATAGLDNVTIAPAPGAALGSVAVLGALGWVARRRRD